MKASETKLRSILEGTKQYVVPLFQRVYSWEKKQWEMLWSDLKDLCEEENPHTHFIGSIVTMPTSSVPEGVAKYLLIDGQQRLTTIFILLSLIRDRAKQTNQDRLADEINNTLLVNPYEDNGDFFKLQPTQADRISFHMLVRDNLPDIQNGSVQNQIFEAYRFFDRKLTQSNLDGQLLKRIITSNLSVVSIVLDTEDNPYLVFESLNAKGLPLTQSDLIRNYFFMRIHVNQQDTIYDAYWKPMQDGLRDNLTEFIRHFLMRDGRIVKQSDVYFSLKDFINNKQIDPLDYLKLLTHYATYYRKLLWPLDEEADKELSKALERLNRIEVTTAYPFLLNCYDEYHQGNLSRNDFLSILRFLENFMIRRFICNKPTNQLNKIFPYLYAQAQKESPNDLPSGVKKVLQTRDYPKDIEFRSRLQDVKLYGGENRHIKTKLILESIEESYGHKEQADLKQLTIEHIMPQTLTEDWKTYLGEDWQAVHDLQLHTIGNLTLTAYNSELSNAEYATKKARLEKSHIEMNKFFTDKSSWKEDDIKDRSAKLAEQCLSIWPYFGEEKPEISKQGDVTGTSPKALWILGQQFTVQSWRDVLENTMNCIADLEPEKFEHIAAKFSSFVSKDKNKFPKWRELKNGVFINVNLNAQNIQSFCFQAIQSVELTSEDWKIETA